MVAGFKVVCLSEAAEEVIKKFNRRDARAVITVESQKPFVLKLVFKNWLLRKVFKIESALLFMQQLYPALKYKKDYDIEQIE